MPRAKIQYPRACIAEGCSYKGPTSSAYLQHIGRHHPELKPGRGRQMQVSPRPLSKVTVQVTRPPRLNRLDSFLAMVAWAFPKGIPTNDKEALAEALAWIHETRMLVFGKEQG